MGLFLIPLKSVAKLQPTLTVEGLVPIWHQFQYQKSPSWSLWGADWQTTFSSKTETHWNSSTSQEHAGFDKVSIRKLFLRWCFSAKTQKWPCLQRFGSSPGYLGSCLKVPVWRNSYRRPERTLPLPSTIPIKFWINWKLTSQIPPTKAKDLFRDNARIKPGSLKTNGFQMTVCDPKSL